MFWLPNYISEAGSFNPTDAADLSAIFDLGGIAGGILAGVISDRTAASATICSIMLVLGVPMLYIFHLYGVTSVSNCIGTSTFLYHIRTSFLHFSLKRKNVRHLFSTCCVTRVLFCFKSEIQLAPSRQFFKCTPYNY
ncbi:hypothetical protein AHF37_10318 [Paragonimus kellicotti]|nr:hypothetical protein AHF37_10318 [Paragonimus kellicotti]